MLLNGGELEGARLLSPKTVTLMTMNHLPGRRTMTEMMPVTTAFNESGYAGVGYGLGVGVTQDVAATGLPGTAGEYSWGGAAGTYFFNDPKEELAVVFMTQVLFAPDRIKLRRDLRTLVYGAMTESFAGAELDPRGIRFHRLARPVRCRDAVPRPAGAGAWPPALFSENAVHAVQQRNRISRQPPHRWQGKEYQPGPHQRPIAGHFGQGRAGQAAGGDDRTLRRRCHALRHGPLAQLFHHRAGAHIVPPGGSGRAAPIL